MIRTRGLSLIVAAALAACSGGTDDATGGPSGGPTQFLQSSLERKAATAGEATSAAADGREFAWDFYRQIADPAQNLVYSPYSVSVAATMLSAGAEGNTLTEMEAVLRMSTDASLRHQSENALAQQLQARNHDATEQTNAQVLRSSNDFWMLPALRPTDPFLDTLAEYYGAGVHLASFDTAPDESRQAINGKVSDDTAGLIPELLPKGSVDPSTVFVLTNALYFKARWDSEFPKEATAPAPFTTFDDRTVDVDMMRLTEHFGYFEGDGFRAASLPYFGQELDLVALLPDAGTFADFIAGLDAKRVQAALDGLSSTKLELWMPKLEIHAEVPLKDELVQAGMVDAFTDGVADFTPIADGVFISDAFHQAAILVDEEGTEAAAATAFVGSLTSAPPPETPVPFHLDAPFVFLLRDRATNAALFVGHYVSP